MLSINLITEIMILLIVHLTTRDLWNLRYLILIFITTEFQVKVDEL